MVGLVGASSVIGIVSGSPHSGGRVDRVQALDEAVDLLEDRVEVEACAVCGGDAEPGQQRLTAVVSGADRDVTTWADMDQAVMPKANRDIQLTAMRGGERVTVQITPDSMRGSM